MDERYSRQMILPQIGEEGQQRLAGATVAIAGLGALGSVSADLLCRAGVGNLKLIDRDYVSLNNLQRCALYTEQDAAESKPKAAALAAHLSAVNSACTAIAHITHLDGGNIEALFAGCDLVLDGSDNFELRYLINEACDKLGIPWVYGGALGLSGTALAILPGHPQSPCFRCLAPASPPPGSYPTCASAGILSSATHAVAAYQATVAIQLLSADSPELAATDGHSTLRPYDSRSAGSVALELQMFDVWPWGCEQVQVGKDPDCPVCGRHEYELLGRQSGAASTSLCGRDEFQVLPVGKPVLDLEAIAQRLRHQGDVLLSPFILSFQRDGLRFKLFSDGRAMIKGAVSEEQALSIYTEYVGL